MQEEMIKKKIERFAKDIVNISYLEPTQITEKQIHAIRISARELLSLLQEDTLLYKNIKKIIKKSNKIRDIDVFFGYFLPIIKHKNIARATIKQIQKSIHKKRKILIVKFIDTLDNISLDTMQVQLVQHPQAQSIDTYKHSIYIVTLEQKILHTFRIDIKNLLYIYKNLHPNKIKKIQKLKNIKDQLGFINDNYNGVKLLETYLSKSLYLKKIKKIMHHRNQHHLERIKELYKGL